LASILSLRLQCGGKGTIWDFSALYECGNRNCPSVFEERIRGLFDEHRRAKYSFLDRPHAPFISVSSYIERPSESIENPIVGTGFSLGTERRRMVDRGASP
jgi:hypothetical protein